jgi:hypothetical protein
MLPVNTMVISNKHHLYWITIAHLGWFCGCLYTQSTGAHGGFATPFEKSQLIQFLSKIENFNSISSQTLASTCWKNNNLKSSLLDTCIPYTGVYGVVHPSCPMDVVNGTPSPDKVLRLANLLLMLIGQKGKALLQNVWPLFLTLSCLWT